MMTKPDEALGGRLPLVDPATMTDAQRALYDMLIVTWVKFADTLGVRATTADGRLIGPFNTFLLHPEVALKLQDFQGAEASHTTLPPRVREVVIVAVGAVWEAKYELFAQFGVGHKLGLSDDAVAALAKGGIPDELSDHEKIAARLARELSIHHRVDDTLYREAEEAFGRTGLLDIVLVMGLYQTVCTALTMFEVPAPNLCRESLISIRDLRNDNRGDLRSNRLAEARRRAATLVGKLSGAILGDRWAGDGPYETKGSAIDFAERRLVQKSAFVIPQEISDFCDEATVSQRAKRSKC